MAEVANKIDHGAEVAAQHGIARSPHWPAVEKAFKALHPDCIYCGPGSGQKVGIQVHHRNAFHCVVGVGRPDLELSFSNLCSLCESEKGRPAPDHHISEGHLGSFQRNSPTVVEDAPQFLGQSRQQIESSDHWKALKRDAPGPFSSWTFEQKKAFRQMLDEKFPPEPEVMAKYFPHGLPPNPFV
jgi:hypothetical protein